MKLLKFISGIRNTPIGKAFAFKERIARSDLGVLKVAFMIAALDGEVTDEEYRTFDLLAKKCRGYTEKAAAAALDEAMRSAGYLMLLARRVKKDADLVKAFLAEAKRALPDGFAYCSLEDVRRAVVLWIAMGMSDGDYSAREQKCIEALRRALAEMRVTKAKAEEERAMLLSPAFRQAYALEGCCKNRAELLSKNFFGSVENLVSKLGDSTDAAKELKKLLAG